jgi:hypothetical protein
MWAIENQKGRFRCSTVIMAHVSVLVSVVALYLDYGDVVMGNKMRSLFQDGVQVVAYKAWRGPELYEDAAVEASCEVAKLCTTQIENA